MRALVSVPLPVMKAGLTHLHFSSLRGRSCCPTFFRNFALLMVAGWTTEGTRALVSVPLPITKVGLTHSRFSSMRITTANVDAGRCAFNMHWPAVNAHRAQCALKCISKLIQCTQALGDNIMLPFHFLVQQSFCVCSCLRFVLRSMLNYDYWSAYKMVVKGFRNGRSTVSKLS